MAQYSHVISIILVAAAVCPPALTAPVTSAPVSVTAVDDQTGTSQIAVDNPLCFETGMRVLKEEGNNAVDAAIASLLCLGVVNFQSSGIGGGMVMVVAEKDPNGSEPKVTVIDARVVAPDSVDSRMGLEYNNNDNKDLALIGPSSITVPGELRGIEMALEMFSKNTKEKREALFADAIKYAEEGFPASEHLANAIQNEIVEPKDNSQTHSFYQSQLRSDSWFEELQMLVQKDDGQYVGEGDTIRPGPNLNATLRAIVQNGFAEFYTGMTATKLVNDISSACAGHPRFCRNLADIITSEDLAEYEAKPRAPFNFSYDASSGYEVYTAPAPYGGPALAVFLGIVTRKVGMTSLEHNVYHYLTEAAKFAASYRMKLGDPDFNSEADVTPAQAEADIQDIIKKLVDDQARPANYLEYYGFDEGESEDGMGTTHLSVVTPNMAVAVTSSINDLFGSGFLSPSTGILLNNDMEGFSLGKRFRHNKIAPRKRPLSAKCPTVVVDSEGNFKLVTGAAGGKRIPPAVGQTMFYALTRKTSAKVASCQPRVYADLLEDNDTTITQQVEKKVEKKGSPEVPGITSELLKWLRIDHNQPDYEDYSEKSVVQSILDVSGTLDAHSDVRKFGGKCNTALTSSWGIHPNVKLLLLFFSFVVQYVCIHL